MQIRPRMTWAESPVRKLKMAFGAFKTLSTNESNLSSEFLVFLVVLFLFILFSRLYKWRKVTTNYFNLHKKHFLF